MPENQLPPTWGPAYEERDLDALLDGNTANLPETLWPLAGTLATLHARPVAAELAGEEAARAAFRLFVPDVRQRTGRAEHGTVRSHTLVLPRPQDERPRRHKPRHRRRPPGGSFRRPATITGVAAAFVLVAGIALATVVSSPIHRSTPSSVSRTPVATGTAPVSKPPKVLGTAKPAAILPTPAAPSNPSDTTDPGTLCREFYGFFNHQETKSGWAAEEQVWGKLEKNAGNPWKVLNYCLDKVGFNSWGAKETAVTPPKDDQFWPQGNGNEGNQGNGNGAQNGNNSGNGSGPGQQGYGNTGYQHNPGSRMPDSHG